MKALIIFIALLLSALAGLIVPSLAYAAPPKQIPSTAAMDSTLQLLTLLANLLAAGGLAFVLDDIPSWHNWVSVPVWLKPLSNFVLTGVLIGTLTALSAAYQGESQAQALISIAVNALAGYFVNQLSHQKDVTFHYRQSEAKLFAVAEEANMARAKEKAFALFRDDGPRART